MKELRPVRSPVRSFDEIEDRIRRCLFEAIYAPLLEDIAEAFPAQPPVLKNSRETPLMIALRTGRLIYEDGRFRGRFTAQTTVELKLLGATWDSSSKTFALAEKDLTPELRVAIATSRDRLTKLLATIDERLSALDPAEIAGRVQASDIFDSTLWRVDRELSQTLAAITVAPRLTDAQRRRLADEWQGNLELWIKDFTEAEIPELRAAVQAAWEQGQRYESLVRTIRRSYGITQNKAKFLARQETSLLVAKFKEVRYQAAGVTSYKWRCVVGSPAHPVRPSHKRLDGKIFRWDAPPITTASNEPQRRNNPGQDYNCRCIAIPIVDFRSPPAS